MVNPSATFIFISLRVCIYYQYNAFWVYVQNSFLSIYYKTMQDQVGVDLTEIYKYKLRKSHKLSHRQVVGKQFHAEFLKYFLHLKYIINQYTNHLHSAVPDKQIISNNCDAAKKFHSQNEKQQKLNFSKNRQYKIILI